MEFPGVSKNSIWNFQGLIKSEAEFPRVTKKKLEFARLLVFGLGIAKGSNKILWSFLGWSLVFFFWNF